MEKTIEQIAYPTRIEARNGFAYSAATTLIIGLSQSHESIAGKIYYFLDDSKTQVVRTDISKRTVELSDEVDEVVTEEIKKMLEEDPRKTHKDKFSDIFKDKK